MLIVTEGHTEVDYIERLIQHMRATGVSVCSVKSVGLGRDPMRVLEAVKFRMKSSDAKFDFGWAVVDVDRHERLPQCIAEAKKHGNIDVAISNPCFEVWLLWHFREHVSHVDANMLKRLLEKEGMKGKSLPKDFPIDAYLDAIQRAEGIIPDDGDYSRCNPSSAMPKVVHSIKASEERP
ncbi:RloB family protein [Nocardia sp. NPDC004151]|uniref:RloB family protein n=1 Tax=Nocardia sp. NPDC004151 TaxID=3364304 RepID=UPI0036CFD3FC